VQGLGPDGKDVTVWVGARAEALHILATLPAAGRTAYATAANPRGKELLESARKKGDWQLVRDVARRYPLTPAGIESARLLGTHHLDRGEVPQAARWFQLWQQRNPSWPTDALGAYLAWAAFLSSGQTAQAEECWKQLQKHHPGGVKLGKQTVTLANLKTPWETARPAAAPAASSWSMFAGNAGRNAVAGKWPVVEALQWSASLGASPMTAGLVEDAVRLQEDRPQPVLSGHFPIVVGDKLICRTAVGVQALTLTTGKAVWERPMELSFNRLLADYGPRTVIEYWLNAYMRYHPHVLLENTSIGCLSGDGKRVYAVDDLPVIPYVPKLTGKKYSVMGPTDPVVTAAVQRSRLYALDAATGAVAWEVGRKEDGNELLNNCYFLGPPLPVHGKLYGVAEYKGDLCLYCLEPSTGKLLWKQCLGSPQYQITNDGGRRLQAVHLTYDQGILLCPTNGGAVLAYDLHTSSFLWAHAYRNKSVWNGAKLKGLRPAKELEIESIPNLRNQLQVSAPVICKDRVVAASCDSPVVECLRLSDGAVLWKVERTPDDLFLAGVQQDKVLLVGRKACRALSVADGKEVWQTEVGLPAGQGVFVGESYVLPIRNEAQANTTSVVSLHLGSGELKRLADLPGQLAAGNFLLVEDRLIAQNATGIAGWGKGK
jgi:outer membrane protein assembly factor BamB